VHLEQIQAQGRPYSLIKRGISIVHLFHTYSLVVGAFIFWQNTWRGPSFCVSIFSLPQQQQSVNNRGTGDFRFTHRGEAHNATLNNRAQEHPSTSMYLTAAAFKGASRRENYPPGGEDGGGGRGYGMRMRWKKDAPRIKRDIKAYHFKRA
jgi:hypothetical protein